MSGGEDGGVMSARVLCCDELCIMRRCVRRMRQRDLQGEWARSWGVKGRKWDDAYGGKR